MYKATDAFLTAMDTEPCRVLAGETVLDSVELTQRWCTSDFSLGSVCAAAFTAKVTANILPFGRGDWVELTMEVEEESLPLGRFKLTQVSAAVDEGYFTITGEDAASTLLEQPFVVDADTMPAPALLQAIGEKCALNIAGAELVPEVEMAVGKDKSMRALVGEIALRAGANARIDRFGVLRLSRLQGVDWAVMPERYYESALELDEADYAFGSLTVVAGDEVFSRQTEGVSRGLAFSCDSFDQVSFDTVWNAWQGIKFRPGSVSFLGNPLLDPGDVIVVSDRAGNVFALPVFELRHSFDGGVRTTVTARVQEAEQAAPETISQAMSGLKLDLGKFKRLYADDLYATNAEIKNLNVEVLKARTILVVTDDGTVVLKADADTGELVATKGTIGGLLLSDRALTATYTKIYPEFTGEDITKARNYILGLEELTAEELEKYDVNMDGRITGLDTLAMQKMMAGLEPNYSVYQFSIDASQAQACVTVEVTEGYHAGWKSTIGMGGMSTRNLTVSSMLDVEGDLILHDSYVTDFVIESGEADFWHYEKWYSGKAVCWGKKTYDSVDITAPWGGLYESASPMSEAFPEDLFIDLPDSMDISFLTSDSGAGFIERGPCEEDVLTAASTGCFWICRGTAMAGMTNAVIGFHALGRWK